MLPIGHSHANLIHILKQFSDKLTNRQTHWVEKLMPYANLMRILYRKGILNEADPVSQRPVFLPFDNMYMLDESLWWDGKVPDIDTNVNGPKFSALESLEASNVNDDFLSNLKGACFTCAYFSNENIERRLRKKLRNHPTGYLDITTE
jgi:hypothetical protein